MAKMNPKMLPLPRLLRLAGLLPVLGLAACAGSQRFNGPGAGPGMARGPVYSETVQSAPPISSAPVMSEPLPPPGGYPVAAAPPGSGAGLPPTSDPFFDPQAAPQGQQPVERVTEAPPQLRGQVANANPNPTPAPARSAGASRDAVVGSWTAQEATGGSCRVQLSSAPSLDLYRATANGCSNRELQQVNAWDYRDGEVYLYQRGGSVVARLRVSGGGAMNGAVTKSGAALSLNR